jgi:diaminopimelate epimerase
MVAASNVWHFTGSVNEDCGTGCTLASGSSSTTAAVIAHKLGFCESDITVHMPGGRLRIRFSKSLFATMTCPVTKIGDGEMTEEMFDEAYNKSDAGEV